MLRRSLHTLVLVTLAIVAQVAFVVAASGANPPPGSVQLQPASASAGSTGVGTGPTGASSGDQGTHTNTRLSSGTGTSGGGTDTTGLSAYRADGAAVKAAKLTPTAAVRSGFQAGSWFGWLLLLLLFAALCMLFGFAVGRRRSEPAPA
jgi:hypothetical protein